MLKVCVLNSGSSVLTIPRVIAMAKHFRIVDFIELGSEIKEHIYIEETINKKVTFFHKGGRVALKLSRELKKIDADFYMVFYASGINLEACALANDKPIISICMGSDVRFVKNKISYYYKKKLWQNCNLLVAKSNNLKHKLQTLSNSYTITTNYWGIDTSYFDNTSKYKARQNININQDKYVVISPRAFTKLYNIELVIDAFLLAKNAIKNAFLLLIGRAPDKLYLQAIKNKLQTSLLVEGVDYRIDGAIEYNKISDYYYAADIALSFAAREGFPTSLFELFYCKCPVIAGNISSFKNDIITNEKDVIFSSFQANSISNKMLMLYNNNIIRQSIVQNAIITFNKYGNINKNSLELSEKIKLSLNKQLKKKHITILTFMYFFVIFFNKIIILLSSKKQLQRL